MEKYISSSDLAKVLRLTTQRVNQLAKEQILKREADGKFDLSDAVVKYFTFKFKTDEEINYARQHARLEKAKADMAEIELAEHEGSLLHAAEVEQAMASMILNCKSRLLSIPSKCSPRIIGQKSLAIVSDILRKEVYQALSELHEMPAEQMLNAPTEDVTNNI